VPSQESNEALAPVEDYRLTINTRSDWSQWLPASYDVTSRMIELGTNDFLRYRGIRTVEVLMHQGSASRIMVWRGLEEVPAKIVTHEIADNAGYVSSNRWPIID
tara:strand:- start:187 stop:498 length:312 start_codon:yes stop_codon:yes gene_type:complete